MRILSLILLCLLFPLQVQGEESAARRVARISLEGVEGAEVQELLGLLAVEEGGVLTRRAVRRSVQRLYETGRFANVEALASEREGGVHLAFRLSPKRLVREIEVAGVSWLQGQEAVRATGLQTGMEYTSDLLARAEESLRTTLARAGYETASVEGGFRGEGEGVRLHFRVQPGSPTRMVERTFLGEVGDKALVNSAFALRIGDVFDRNVLERDLDALRTRFRREGYFRAEIGTPTIRKVSDTGVAVEIPASSGPKFTFAFAGHRAFDEERLRGFLSYDGEEFLDRAMASDLASRLEGVYRRHGYYEARVVAEESVSRDRKRARLVFHIQEGLPLIVRTIELRGNQGISRATLQAWVKEEFESIYAAPPLVRSPVRGEVDASWGSPASVQRGRRDPSGIFDDQAYQALIEALVARYREEGYLEAKIHGPFVDIDEPTRVASVELRVEEGRRTWIRGVEYLGVKALQPSFLVSGDVREGKPLSERRVDQHRIELQSLYARFGHLYALVEAEIHRPPEDPARATVRFHVHEGPKVRVGQILVQGNDRTRTWVVRQSLGVREGDILTSDRIATGQQELMRLGLFRAATLRPIDPDLPEGVKDLVVEVRERPGRALELGGGISIADGPRAFAEYRDRNILGRNLQLVLRGRVNHQIFREDVRDMPLEDGLERDLQAGIRFPRIWGVGFPLGWHFDLIHERDIRLAYNLYRNSALTGFEFPLADSLQATLRFELESNDIEHSSRFDALYGPLSRTDLERIRFPNGNVLLGSVRPGLLLDLRDDVAFPRRGILAKVEADLAQNLGGSTTVDFVKLSGTVTGYVPLWKKTTLVLSGGAGKVFHLRDDSVAIPPKRFYLGGAGTLRGFAEDTVVPQDRRAALRGELADCQALLFRSGCTQQARFLDAGRAVPSEGGDLFVLGRGELRFPVYGNLMGGVFLDAGNLWLDTPSSIDLAELRKSVGFGLRYATPVGPIALDLGFNLDADRAIGEPPVAVHFSVGLF